MNVVWAAFSSYVLALAKNLYGKCTRKHVDKIDRRCQEKEGPVPGPHDCNCEMNVLQVCGSDR